MAVDSAAVVTRLVEELLDSGRSPEEVCVDSPHLLGAVRARWELCRRMEGVLDELFISPPGVDGGRSAGGPPEPAGRWRRARTSPDGPLPEVPGYELEAVLGRGGMGIVYRALDLRLERRVALKMILSGDFASRHERARFLREARAVAALRHPHVVQVYEVDEHDGRPYYTMELVDGGTLAARLAGAPLPPADAAALFEPLADAVRAAHAAGIVHRDLKPGNVLLGHDGEPKVADFGLARRTDGGGEAITLTGPGPGPGTPSYMAPEQVAGTRGAAGPAADVYGLGAVLYEMLTGRPPFRGDSPAETARQVLSDEPAPPSRLNGRVPRDLETICLKCLHKAPSRRYATAAALADDVRRFRRGEPIAARAVGRAERAAKWVRRKPAAATAILATVALVLAGGGGGLWLASERAAAAATAAATAATAGADIDAAVALQRRGEWDLAADALARADSRVVGAGGGPPWLRDRLAAARRDQELVARLAAARVAARPVFSGSADADRAAGAFAAVLREFGVGAPGDDPAVVAARVRASAVKLAIVAALDEWCIFEWDRQRTDWMTAVARAADPDPTGWRDRARLLRRPADPRALAELAEQAVPAAQPTGPLLRVGYVMQLEGLDPIPYLSRVARAHPSDVWVNLTLGAYLCDAGRTGPGLEHLRAAVALQPRLVYAQVYLANALSTAGRADEGLECLTAAAAADPSYWVYPQLIGVYEARAGRPAAAGAALDAAARLAPPGQPFPPLIRGTTLLTLGREDEGLVEYRLAVSLDPRLTHAQGLLREALLRRGEAVAARDAWRAALAADPVEHAGWDGYAELCLYLGDEAEYRAACRRLLAKFGGSIDPPVCERTGRACLMLPSTDADELGRATRLIDRALAAPSPSARGYGRFYALSKALADHRAGRHAEALAAVEGAGPAAGALVPIPMLVAALAHQRLGHGPQARAALRDAALALDWAPDLASTRELWVCHVLRREAERLIAPDLQAFLDGAHQPRSADERVALTAVCRATGRPAAEARLWADAMAADPALAAKVRPRAVRAAAQAGCGLGADAAGVDDAARSAWRGAARQWLAEELDAAERLLQRADPRDRATGRAAAAGARSSAGVLRDPAQLARLSPGERAAVVALFARADRAAAAVDARPASGPATTRSAAPAR